jgi:hypothetical protein
MDLGARATGAHISSILIAQIKSTNLKGFARSSRAGGTTFVNYHVLVVETRATIKVNIPVF